MPCMIIPSNRTRHCCFVKLGTVSKDAKDKEVVGLEKEVGMVQVWASRRLWG